MYGIQNYRSIKSHLQVVDVSVDPRDLHIPGLTATQAGWPSGLGALQPKVPVMPPAEGMGLEGLGADWCDS